MKPKLLILTVMMMVLLAPLAAQDQGKGAQVLQLLQSWQARLNLTDAQKTQAKGLLEQLGQKLEQLGDKVDAGEVDRKTAFQQMQAARKDFRQSFGAILNDAQKKEWDQMQEEMQGFVAKRVGAKWAAKMQQQYKLSDSQTQACVPVLAKQAGELMEFFEQAQGSKAGEDATGGGRRARRAKLKQAQEMKGIADDADEELKKIFTPEQWQQYQADKAKRREEMKQKLQQSRG
jgi:hypothetical protein